MLLGQLHELEPYLAHAGMDQADFPGDTIGYINFAPFLIGTPVIDPYQLEPAVPGVDHANDGAKGKIGVCRSKGFGVEALAIGGLAVTVPGALANWISHPGSIPTDVLDLFGSASA